MSTENNTPVEPVQEDLDLFSDDFFGQKKTEPEPASSEEDQEDSEEESDANSEEDTHSEEPDTLATDEEDEEEDVGEEDTDPTPKPKKNRFQERIDELTGKQREAERKLAEALAEIEKLKVQDKEPQPTPITKKDGAPDPDALNEDGTPKYPMGDYDPQYLMDSVRYDLEQERIIRDEQTQRETAQKAEEEQRNELQASWSQKLEPAKEKYPDFEEKGQELVSAFENIDAAYGDYLTATLMSMEYGPDVLYHLANNPDEAMKIVQSGPTRATIALGRLEAKFADVEAEKQLKRPKVSNAPTPPDRLNKGSSPAMPEVPDDTDDLDAFEKKLFAKTKRR